MEATISSEAENEGVPPPPGPVPSVISAKWQGAVTKGSGFVAVPMALLRLQTRYDLSATEMLVLINFLAHWWDADRPVFPRSTTIARRMGIEVRTVQRATSKMEKAGLIKRGIDASGRRIFSFEGLVAKLVRDVPAAFTAQVSESVGS